MKEFFFVVFVVLMVWVSTTPPREFWENNEKDKS